MNTWLNTGLNAGLRRASLGLLALALAACSDSGSYDPPGDAAEGAPALNVVSISASAGSPITYGDQVTVQVEASEAILAPTVLIANAPADSITGSANAWTARRTMQLGDPDGEVSIMVRVRDRDGGASIEATQTTDGSAVMFQNPTNPYRVVWEENFDGSSLDGARWNIQTGDGTAYGLPAGWGNNEQQLYNADQISVGGGMLTITVASPSSGQYRSARINTRGKFDFNYGRVEVRAKLPAGQGIWPAIWLLHTNETYGPWPQSGEIDILEAINLGVSGRKTISSSIHYGFPWPDNSFHTQEHTPTGNPQDAFHVYMLEWEPDGELRFYFDGAHYATFTPDNWFTVSRNESGPMPYTSHSGSAPFNHPFHLLANVAVGGDLPGAPDSTTSFPQTLEIDYIRVSECLETHELALAQCATMKDATVTPPAGPGSANVHNTITLYEANEVSPLSFVIEGTTYTNQPTVDGFDAGASGGTPHTLVNSRSAQDPTNPPNSVWRFQVSGGVANAFITSEDQSSHALLDTGFNFAGSDRGSRLVFDMYVDTLSDGTSLLVKLDSGYPNLGQVTVPDVELDQWKTYSIAVKQFVDNPLQGVGGSGVDLESVLNPFVIEPANATAANISADLYLDNIRLEFACPGDVDCMPRHKLKRPKGTGAVYADALAPEWESNGAQLSAFDQAIGFASCVGDGGSGCPSIGWTEVDVAGRGKVIEVTYTGTMFAGLIVGQNLKGLNMSDFAGGTVKFDLRVTANPSSVNFRMKADCVGCPVDAGQREQDLGLPTLNTWTTQTVNVDSMVNANGGPTAGGLKLGLVTTGLVIFPPFGMTEGVSYQLDNVRWEAAASAP